MSLHELPTPHQMWLTLSKLAENHPRMADAVESMWGQPECQAYLQKLILDGYDQSDRAQIRFTQDDVARLMKLMSLHQHSGR